jgi:hypothetical protein
LTNAVMQIEVLLRILPPASVKRGRRWVGQLLHFPRCAMIRNGLYSISTELTALVGKRSIRLRTAFQLLEADAGAPLNGPATDPLPAVAQQQTSTTDIAEGT